VQLDAVLAGALGGMEAAAPTLTVTLSSFGPTSTAGAAAAALRFSPTSRAAAESVPGSSRISSSPP
jgi:hypothetical protein